MVSNLSPYGEAAVLGALLPSNQAYVSLHTGDPANTGANEVLTTGGTSYARVLATFSNAVGGSSTVASNTSIVTFAPAGANWGTVTYFGVWDALTAGNFRGSGSLTTSKVVNNGDTARFIAGAVTITVA